MTIVSHSSPPPAKQPDVPSPAARLAWLLSGAVCVLAVLATWKVFWSQDGDAAVYWVYARSMWQDGPFRFAHAPVSYGATSPAWALVLSLASLPSGGASILAWKLAGALALLVLAATVWVFARRLTGSPLEAAGAAALVALHPGLRLFAVSSYETPFFAALVANAALATTLLPSSALRPRTMTYALLSLALLPLGRPEGLLVAGGLSAVVLARHRSIRVAGLLALTLVPFLAFAAWMHGRTGLWVPSSVAARQMMSAVGDTYLTPAAPPLVVARGVGLLFDGPPGFRIISLGVQALLVALGLHALQRTRPAFVWSYVVLGTLLAVGLTLNNPGYYLMRYAMPMLPFAAVAMVHGAGTLFSRLSPRLRHAAVPVTLALGVITVGGQLYGSVQAATGPRRAPIDVLDASGAETLNPLLAPSDVVLTYEVQTAYHLNVRVVSADGIVGGEILPYLRTGDLRAFLRDQHITVVLTATAYEYRSVYRNTLLETLAQRDATIGVGETVTIADITFRKIAAQPRPEGSAFWRGAYAVVPVSGGA